MPYKDPEKRRLANLEANKRYREKHRDPNTPAPGKHGNHVRGAAHHRWNSDRIITEHNYVLVRVPEDHHLRQAHGYAYEHQIVAEQKLGRRLLDGETVDHVNEDTTDNHPDNLRIWSSHEEHMREHYRRRQIAENGQFLPKTS